MKDSKRSSTIYSTVVATVIIFVILPAPLTHGHLVQPRFSKGWLQVSSALPQVSNNSDDILLHLAQQCANDLSSNPGCLAFIKTEKQEYVIIKDNDPVKPQGYLLIPVLRVTGIEDEQVFASPFVDLWASAWLWSEKYPGKRASLRALAVNSLSGRSQNQLHIHISCVLPEVAKALVRKKIPSTTGHAVPLRLGRDRNMYWAVAVSGLDGANSPFQIVRALAQAHKTEMKDQGILVAGTKDINRYYILDSATETGNPGHAEELLDQTCEDR